MNIYQLDYHIKFKKFFKLFFFNSNFLKFWWLEGLTWTIIHFIFWSFLADWLTRSKVAAGLLATLIKKMWEFGVFEWVSKPISPLTGTNGAKSALPCGIIDRFLTFHIAVQVYDNNPAHLILSSSSLNMFHLLSVCPNSMCSSSPI